MTVCKKIPLQLTMENIEYIDKNNISYARLINTLINLTRLEYINIKKIEDLSVFFQNGEYNEEKIKEVFRL